MLSKKYDKIMEDKRKEFIDNFWLNLGDVTNIETTNPLLANEEWQRENPLLHIVDIMRRPENFYFTCKWLLGIELHPLQAAIQKILWEKPFPMMIATRGGSKTSGMAFQTLLRLLFTPNCKVVVVGAAYRQSKHVFHYCESIYKNSKMLRDILSNDKMNRPSRDIDRCVFRINNNTATFLPLGNGEKIRGERATHLYSEEFNSMPPDIYEEVVQGFAAVSASPIISVKQVSRIKALKELGCEDAMLEENKQQITSNQSVISGTCGYEFEHFCSYWKRYKAIIESRGDTDKLNEIFNGEIPLGFNWKDYAIIRIPYDLFPDGFLDPKSIGKSKATISLGMFSAEYGTIFIKDSEGFFRRSLIQQAVCGNPKNPIYKQSCGEVNFSALIRGDYKKRYIYSIDPASESDNLSVTILELWPDHRRVVYCWTMDKARHSRRLKKGLIKEHDYFRYCVRKIRDLMKLFPCERIVMDKMGGGISLREAFGDPINANVEQGEQPIYEIIDEDEPKDTDDLNGLHILELISFSDAEWVFEANQNLKKDLEARDIIFPLFDSISIALAAEEDSRLGRVGDEENDLLYDTLESCVLEIEETKNELTTIVHSRTPNGRDKWDTPEIKSVGMKKGRLRKDRYTSLLMGNMSGRILQKPSTDVTYKPVGGIAQQISEPGINKKDKSGKLYVGAQWFTNQANKPFYGVGVRH